MHNDIEPAEKNNKLKYLLIAVILVLLLTNGVMVYFYINNTNEIIDKKKQLKFTTTELLTAQSQVDSMYMEIEKRIKDYELLETTNDSLSKSHEGIDELRAALKKMTVLKNSFKNDAGKAWRLYNDSKDKLEGFKELLVLKDLEIERLKKENKFLFSENKELKQNKAEASTRIDSMRFIEEELKEKVKVASTLEAQNIVVSYINQKKKEKIKQPFKGDKIARLKITFNLAINKVALVETKPIFLKLMDESGKTLLDQSANSHSFSEDGKVFSAKQAVLYSRDNQTVEFFFSKGGNYKEGKYKLEIFCEGSTIGKGSFEIK